MQRDIDTVEHLVRAGGFSIASEAAQGYQSLPKPGRIGPVEQRTPRMEPLKLIALDGDDLAIVSAHLQDAVLKVADMAFRPRERRLVLMCNRFDWAEQAAAPSQGRTALVRRQAALRIERVSRAQLQGIDLAAHDTVLALLAVQFSAGELPAGTITLTFAGNAAIRLEVECVEAGVEDLGPAWAATAMPRHDDKPDEGSRRKP